MNNRLKKYFDEMEAKYKPPDQPKGESLCEYMKACIHCGTSHGLVGFAHGNQDDKVVGILILCSNCQELYAGKNIKVDIDIREE
jgi:hypothetical protein